MNFVRSLWLLEQYKSDQENRSQIVDTISSRLTTLGRELETAQDYDRYILRREAVALTTALNDDVSLRLDLVHAGQSYAGMEELTYQAHTGDIHRESLTYSEQYCSELCGAGTRVRTDFNQSRIVLELVRNELNRIHTVRKADPAYGSALVSILKGCPAFCTLFPESVPAPAVLPTVELTPQLVLSAYQTVAGGLDWGHVAETESDVIRAAVQSDNAEIRGALFVLRAIYPQVEASL